MILPSRLGETHLWLGRGGGARLAAELAGRPGPRLLLTDARVARAQARRLEELAGAVPLERLVLPAGEAAKSSANLLALLAELAQLGLERGSPLLAFGGGVVGDLGGLAASLWARGIPFLNAPTSLLAMVDACIGGKTAINFAGRRNAVGSFWPARAVVADLDCLDTLPPREWASGFGELLKAAWLSDDAWAEELEGGATDLLRADHPALEGHLERALRFKAAVVAADEFEAGGRALLNFGHSYAHALEAQPGVDLAHGQAVLLGMLAAVRAARLAGVATAAAARRMEGRLGRVLASLGLLPSPRLAGLPVPRLMAAMTADKKVRGGRLRLVLPREPGRAELREAAQDLVERSWREWKERLA